MRQQLFTLLTSGMSLTMTVCDSVPDPVWLFKYWILISTACVLYLQSCQYRKREITQTEIQSAYRALLLGSRFVMEVCNNANVSVGWAVFGDRCGGMPCVAFWYPELTQDTSLFQQGHRPDR